MLDKLPPRERQIVDILYARGESSAGEVCDSLADGISNSAVRAMLSRLETKGFVRRRHAGRSFVYEPAVPEAKAKQSALRQLVRTFFNGSPAGAASALLGMSERVEPEELDELERLIARARREQAR